jgi:hypothetical protein
MGKHGHSVSCSAVVTHFRNHGYEYVEPDEFTKGSNKDCVFLEFVKYINPDHRRGDHIDVLLRCGWYYNCEYRRGNKYINRTNDDLEDQRIADIKTHIKPVSFEITLSCRSIPTVVVDRILMIGKNTRRFWVSGSAIVGANIKLKHIDSLLAILDTHTVESVPKVLRYFNK